MVSGNQTAKLNAVALANTFAIIDLVLHPLFHIWVGINPDSYEKLMRLFVAGLRVDVEPYESSLWYIVGGAILEAGLFWILGFAIATLYNKLTSRN